MKASDIMQSNKIVTFDDFIQWEGSTKDVLDVKKIYIDIAGDLIAGVILSELLYWYLPSKDGKPNKLKVSHEGKKWIACRRYEWWDRIRITPRQADLAIGRLVKLELVEKAVYKFNGDPTLHVRIVEITFLKAFWNRLEKPIVNPFSPVGDNEITPAGIPVTETTIPENTRDIPVPGKEPGTTLKPTNAIPVKFYDPDEPEITKKVGRITKKANDPRLYPFAQEVASLCSLALGNGADGELFRAAKLLCAGVNAPKTPQSLRPFFAKGGKVYSEWPWSSGERLKPMDIVKHWPRLSGAIKPPELASRKRVYAEEV